MHVDVVGFKRRFGSTAVIVLIYVVKTIAVVIIGGGIGVIKKGKLMGVTRWVILGGNGQSNLEKEGGCEEDMVHYHLNVSHVLLLELHSQVPTASCGEKMGSGGKKGERGNGTVEGRREENIIG